MTTNNAKPERPTVAQLEVAARAYILGCIERRGGTGRRVGQVAMHLGLDLGEWWDTLEGPDSANWWRAMENLKHGRGEWRGWKLDERTGACFGFVYICPPPELCAMALDVSAGLGS